MKFHVLTLCLVVAACGHQPYSPANEPKQVHRPTDQVFLEYNPTYLAWYRKHGVEELSEKFGIPPERYDRSVVNCLAEYEFSKTVENHRILLDRAARLEEPMTYDQRKAIQEYTMTNVKEDEALAYCGINDLSEILK